MFAALAQAIEEVEIPTDTTALAELLAILDQLNAKVSDALARVDEAKLWELDGATSMVAWLRTHAGRSNRDAARATVTARRLACLPALADAWRHGRLTGGQIDAVLANLPARHTTRFAQTEHLVTDGLEGRTLSETIAFVQRWVRRADAVDPTPQPNEPERALHHSRTLGDRYETNGSFDPEAGAIVATALRVAETKDLDGERTRAPAERRADALTDIAKFFLDHQQTRLGGRHRPHLNIVVDLDHHTTDGGQVIGGPHLDAATIKRYLCDAGVHRVVTDGGSSILDYGRTTRTAPPALFNALVALAGGCEMGECDRGPEWVDVHHIIHWEDGGTTDIDNSVLGYRRHHWFWHQPGCHVKRLPNGEVHTTAPDGRVFIHRPRGRPPELL